MAKIIKYLFAAFWTAATVYIGILAYTVTQKETDPGNIWAWLVFCGFAFISATWLSYNAIFARFHKPEPKHHELHLK